MMYVCMYVCTYVCSLFHFSITMVLPTINTMVEALQVVVPMYIVLRVPPQHSLDAFNFESKLTTSFPPIGVVLFVFHRKRTVDSCFKYSILVWLDKNQ